MSKTTDQYLDTHFICSVCDQSCENSELGGYQPDGPDDINKEKPVCNSCVADIVRDAEDDYVPGLGEI